MGADAGLDGGTGALNDGGGATAEGDGEGEGEGEGGAETRPRRA